LLRLHTNEDDAGNDEVVYLSILAMSKMISSADILFSLSPMKLINDGIVSLVGREYYLINIDQSGTLILHDTGVLASSSLMGDAPF
jgi:hypothetical protein